MRSEILASTPHILSMLSCCSITTLLSISILQCKAQTPGSSLGGQRCCSTFLQREEGFMSEEKTGALLNAEEGQVLSIITQQLMELCMRRYGDAARV